MYIQDLINCVNDKTRRENQWIHSPYLEPGWVQQPKECENENTVTPATTPTQLSLTS